MPELEKLLRTANPIARSVTGVVRTDKTPSDGISGAAEGVELIGADGRAWRGSAGAEQAAGPYYNPLDVRVQQAMRRRFREMR